jgi:ABC-type antimicrobial peptide transport system permease subunit
VLLATFALVALTLAAVGIGGVIAYMVKQRSRDIGIRIALGAGKLRVTSMVVGQGARLLAVGVVVGLAGSIALSRMLESWLFGVEPFDLAVYATAPVVLMIVGMAACWIPARRATRVDPAVAMREE